MPTYHEKAIYQKKKKGTTYVFLKFNSRVQMTQENEMLERLSATDVSEIL